jgi:hypothetical protein
LTLFSLPFTEILKFGTVDFMFKLVPTNGDFGYEALEVGLMKSEDVEGTFWYWAKIYWWIRFILSLWSCSLLSIGIGFCLKISAPDEDSEFFLNTSAPAGFSWWAFLKISAPECSSFWSFLKISAPEAGGWVFLKTSAPPNDGV